MKSYPDIEQGTPAWKALRIGVVTGSGIDGVLTPGTLKPSKSADYFQRIVAEILTGESCEDFDGNADTERGTLMEDEARNWYAFDRGVEVTRVGFVARDDGRVGCSPDSLVGDDGGLEIKCPMVKAHIGYALDPATLAAKYRGQTQVFLYVTGRKWIDLLAFHPDFEKVVVRVLPDAEYQAALGPALAAFLARVDAAVAKLAPTYSAPCPL